METKETAIEKLVYEVNQGIACMRHLQDNIIEDQVGAAKEHMHRRYFEQDAFVKGMLVGLNLIDSEYHYAVSFDDEHKPILNRSRLSSVQ